jgi:hypothetical protein
MQRRQKVCDQHSHIFRVKAWNKYIFSFIFLQYVTCVQDTLQLTHKRLKRNRWLTQTLLLWHYKPECGGSHRNIPQVPWGSTLICNEHAAYSRSTSNVFDRRLTKYEQALRFHIIDCRTSHQTRMGLVRFLTMGALYCVKFLFWTYSIVWITKLRSGSWILVPSSGKKGRTSENSSTRGSTEVLCLPTFYLKKATESSFRNVVTLKTHKVRKINFVHYISSTSLTRTVLLNLFSIATQIPWLFKLVTLPQKVR